jgi:endoglucanase
MERQEPTPTDANEGAVLGNRQIAVAGALAVLALVIIIVGVLFVTSRHPPTTGPTPTPTATAPGRPTPTPGAQSNTDIFAGGLYADQLNHAVEAEQRLRAAGETASADLIREISSKPTAIWLGDQYTVAELQPLLATYRADAERLNQTLVFVTYAVPDRDCGGLSAGGLPREDYLEWNRAIAEGLRGSGAVVLVEPDSVAQLSNDSCAGKSDDRLSVLRETVGILSDAGLTLYLDGGGSHWVDVDVMAERLWDAGVDKTRGFFTNVSNYYRVDQERAYADELSARVGDRNYVIDVSRNGNGWQGHWCNPPGAAIGQAPHVTAGTTGLDALLWVKHPGDSDGACNGAPAAGQWWESNALDLVRNQDNRQEG